MVLRTGGGSYSCLVGSENGESQSPTAASTRCRTGSCANVAVPSFRGDVRLIGKHRNLRLSASDFQICQHPRPVIALAMTNRRHDEWSNNKQSAHTVMGSSSGEGMFTSALTMKLLAGLALCRHGLEMVR